MFAASDILGSKRPSKIPIRREINKTIKTLNAQGNKLKERNQTLTSRLPDMVGDDKENEQALNAINDDIETNKDTIMSIQLQKNKLKTELKKYSGGRYKTTIKKKNRYTIKRINVNKSKRNK